MALTSPDSKTLAFLDLSSAEAKCLHALDPDTSFSKIVDGSISLLRKAAEALASGFDFNTSGKNGSEEQPASSEPVGSACFQDALYAPAKP